MTEGKSVDQSVIYRDYFECVRAFNSANTQYLKTADEIATRRQRAIQRAIEIHIEPVLANLRKIQMFSAVVLIGLFFLFCAVLGSAQNSSFFLFILILALLGVGAIATITLIWSTSKIADLVQTKSWAIQMGSPEIPD